MALAGCGGIGTIDSGLANQVTVRTQSVHRWPRERRQPEELDVASSFWSRTDGAARGRIEKAAGARIFHLLHSRVTVPGLVNKAQPGAPANRAIEARSGEGRRNVWN